MPALFMILAAALWAMIGPISRFAFQNGVGAVETAFWRGLIAGAAFLAHSKLTKTSLKVGKKDIPWLIAFSIFGVALLESSNLLAVESAGASFASIMLYSAPAWIAIGSWILFKDQMTKAKFAALILILGGVAGVALSGGHESTQAITPRAILWGTLSGLSYAFFYLFGKVFFKRYRSPTLFTYAFPLASLAMAPFTSFAPKTQTTWGILLFVGFASTYLAYFFYSLGLRRLDATRASLIACLEPVFAALLAAAIWGERLSPMGYASGALVVLGVILISLFP